MSKQLYLVGNWKMNQDLAAIHKFYETFFQAQAQYKCQCWIAPQFIHLPVCQSLSEKFGSQLKVGAQNCAATDNGAFTGEVSAAALKDLGAEFVIIGHSERRTLFSESHASLNQKLHQVLKQGLTAVFCVGESQAERDAGITEKIVGEQLEQGLKGLTAQAFDQMLIAYEPVWAIGTGKTATPEQAQEVHAFIRQQLINRFGATAQKIPLLYGGSVKPDNAQQLLGQADIEGALVGGASLQGPSFSALCKTAL